MQGFCGNGMLTIKQCCSTNWLQMPCCDQFAELIQYVLKAQATHRVTLLLGAYHVPLLLLEDFLDLSHCSQQVVNYKVLLKLTTTLCHVQLCCCSKHACTRDACTRAQSKPTCFIMCRDGTCIQTFLTTATQMFPTYMHASKLNIYLCNMWFTGHGQHNHHVMYRQVP